MNKTVLTAFGFLCLTVVLCSHIALLYGITP